MNRLKELDNIVKDDNNHVASDLEFSDQMYNDIDNVYAEEQFDSDLSGLSLEHSVDFTEDSSDFSMQPNVNGNSIDYDDMSDISSDAYSNGYDMYDNDYYSEDYSNSYYRDSFYSSNRGSYSEAQFSDDVHEKIAAQERAEAEDWEDFAEHNRNANVDDYSDEYEDSLYGSSSYSSGSSFSSSTSSISSLSSDSSLSSLSSSEYSRYLRRRNGIPVEP